MLGAGQCDAQRPVICTVGLHVQFWGGGIAVEVKAEQGAWVVSNGRWAAHAGLAAVVFLSHALGFG